MNTEASEIVLKFGVKIVSLGNLRRNTLFHKYKYTLRDVFEHLGYNDRQIQRALIRRPQLDQPGNRPNSVGILPFVGTIFNRISRVLARRNIRSKTT
jgi:hypothetical protein